MTCRLNLRNYYRQLLLYLSVNMWISKVKRTDLHGIQERYRDLVILPVISQCPWKNTANNKLPTKQLWKALLPWSLKGRVHRTSPHHVTWLWSFRHSGPWSPGYDRLAVSLLLTAGTSRGPDTLGLVQAGERRRKHASGRHNLQSPFRPPSTGLIQDHMTKMAIKYYEQARQYLKRESDPDSSVLFENLSRMKGCLFLNARGADITPYL